MVVVTACLAAAAAAVAGPRAALLPFGAAVGLGLAVLAFTRFELFAALVLLLRSSLDATKLGPTSVDTTGAVALLFIVASIVWLVRGRERWAAEGPSPTSPLIAPLAALFVVALLSAALSTHPLASATDAVRLGAPLVIVVALGRLLTEERTARLILGATLASAVLPVLVAGLQVLTGTGAMVVAGVSRVDGTFLHPNPFAAYLGLIITLAVALWSHVRGRTRIWLGALALACAGALVFTYARGAWAGLVLALVIVGILQDRRILWALGIGLVLVALLVPSVRTRLSDLGQEMRPSGAPGNSLEWRLRYWGQVLEIQRDPVFGIGLRGVQLDPDVARLPHNDPIRIYVELGVLGLAAYAWLLVTLARGARNALRRAPPGLPRGLAVAFAASLAAVVLQSLAANIVTQLVIVWYFVTIASLAMAAARERAPEPAAA